VARKRSLYSRLKPLIAHCDCTRPPPRRHRHTMSGNKLVRLEEDLHFAKQKYLLERGWEYTSKGPGHFWLFCKEFIVDKKPITLMVAEDLATQIQNFVDAIGGEHG